MQSIDEFSPNNTRRVVRLGFAGIFLLVLIYTITSLYHIRESTNHLTEIVEINNAMVTQLYKMRDVIRQRQILLNQMLATDDSFEIEELSLNFFDLAGPFRQAREQVQKLPINKNEADILKELIALIKVAQPINRKAVSLITGGLESGDSRRLVLEAQILQGNLMEKMEQLIDARKLHEVSFVDEGKRSYETVFIGSVISAFFIIVLIVMIARIITVYVSKKNSELILKNTELEQVSKLALEATHTKSAFLATMSHEIRTPLTAIIGFAEINLEHKVSEENRVKHTKSIVRNGKHLLQLINDILDISKVEANRIEFEKQQFSLFKVIDEVENIILPQVSERGLDLIIDYEYPLPEKITGDSLRFKQVLLNLCINAVKFTESGRINLKISCDFYNKKLNVEVIDTGIGMTSEQVENIFDVFTQADSSITRKYGGTGLGLALSKQFVEGMGGNIRVHSLADIGSRFSFWVYTGDTSNVRRIERQHKLVKPDEKEIPDASQVKKVSGKILVAEDNHDNQQLFSILLQKTGAEVTIAGNGAQAVEQATNTRFDLIFMDMQMPVMDGLEATRKLRKNGCNVPIVSLTANAMKQDREACFEAGVDDYITKPINKPKFYYLVYKYLQPATAQEYFETEISHDLEKDPDIIMLKNRFIDGLSERMKQINDNLANRLFNKVKSEVHKIKGLGGSFGFEELSDKSSQIEQAIFNQEVEKVIWLVKELDQHIQQIVKNRIAS